MVGSKPIKSETRKKDDACRKNLGDFNGFGGGGNTNAVGLSSLLSPVRSKVSSFSSSKVASEVASVNVDSATFNDTVLVVTNDDTWCDPPPPPLDAL